ncbi:hypothetical protein [Streptomyces anulatus]
MVEVDVALGAAQSVLSTVRVATCGPVLGSPVTGMYRVGPVTVPMTTERA